MSTATTDRTLNTQQLLLRAIDTITRKLGRTPVTAPHLATGTLATWARATCSLPVVTWTIWGCTWARFVAGS